MFSNSIYHKNYTEFGDPYQLVLPLNLEGLVPDDDSVRLLSHELEDSDYSLLYQAYSAKGRNPAVDPKTMFKILTYAYSQNIYSSRKIETACSGISTLCGCLPDRKLRITAPLPVFVLVFWQMPAKICSIRWSVVWKQAETYQKKPYLSMGQNWKPVPISTTFVWKKSVGKWETKMYERIQEAVCLLNLDYVCQFHVKEESRTCDLLEICRFLEEKCRLDGTVFVHGRGKRKSRNQRYLEVFRRFLERQTIYDWHTASFQGRNNYCKTDPDATFMHMKDDHMRNAQLKPGYNVQIAVDSEYIVSTEIFQDRNDVWTLVPFLKHMEANLGFRYPSVTADSGYESEETYEYLKSHGQIPYIKPQTYEKWKKRSFKKDISKRENMAYDEKADIYICHAGKTLKEVSKKKQKSKSGYQSEVTVYECEDCSGCPHKEKCTKAKGNKRLYLSKNFLKKRQESYENILSEKGILYRTNRSIQVEGAFEYSKNDYEFQRFLLRGKTKVKLEILLLCLGYNLNKLHSKIQNERTGSHLFQVKRA